MYGGYGGNWGCGYDSGWLGLLLFLLIIATIFVFVGFDGNRRGYDGADAEAV